MTIVFWWNPLVWFYKKSLRTVHEYLADDAVLQTTKKKQYGQLLIRQSHSGMQVALANNFIQSQLKNRIMMMMKSKSQSQQLWKYLLFLPVLGLLFMTFSCENATAQSEEKTVLNTDDIYKVVEEMPRFAGTDVSNLTHEEDKRTASNKLMLEYIYKNVTYPANAREEGIEGMTVIRFTVDKSGKLRDFETVRSVHKELDAEAIRVAKSMPDWIPGKQRGKVVNVQFNLLIKFKLADDEAELPSQQVIKGDKRHTDVDEMPYFPGCDEPTLTKKRSCSDKKMLEHIFTNIKYPKEAQKEDAEGMVVVKFIVEKDGQLTNPKILRSVHPKCDEEVLRLVNEMPNWIPAVKDGKKVAVEFKLPVKFKLSGKKTEETTSKILDNQSKELDIREFKAFPNPASDALTLQFSTEEETVKVKIIDANGQCFSTINVMNLDRTNKEWKSEKIDISEIARGLLLIQMSNKKGTKQVTKKVMVQ
jgi:TonB family protein